MEIEIQVIKKIVKKLIGEIHPIGETHIDEKRFNNLEELMKLIDTLLYDIKEIANINKEGGICEKSIYFTSKKAKEYINEIKESL